MFDLDIGKRLDKIKDATKGFNFKDRPDLKKLVLDRNKQILDGIRQSKGDRAILSEDSYDVEGLLNCNSLALYSSVKLTLAYNHSLKIINFDGNAYGLGLGKFVAGAVGIFNYPIDDLAGKCSFNIVGGGEDIGGFELTFWNDDTYMGFIIAAGIAEGAVAMAGSGDWSV